MKVIVKDTRYFPLNELKRGEIAVGVPKATAKPTDKPSGPEVTVTQSIYACVCIPADGHGASARDVIIELTDLSSQYFDHLDLDVKVRRLAPGETVTFLM
jgi:hypothetical protein